MSQRIFQTERYEVLPGWDRQLQRFFLVIEDLNPHGDEYGR